MGDVFAAVDLSTVATWAGGVGVTIIAIALVFKAVGLGKRGISKA